VEEVFVRTGRIWHLHANRQVIRTTAEHPFWVKGKGWVPTRALQPGDLLSSADGQWVAVEEVYDTGEDETVYNMRVADHHTYFVGCQEWGFSVWAHNLCRVTAPGGLTNKDMLNYKDAANVPAHYRDPKNPIRFDELATDPAHKGGPRAVTHKTRAEAMAALEAENLGIGTNFQRSQKPEIDFFDAQGKPYDAKTPPVPGPGEKWPFDAAQTADSIIGELRKPEVPNFVNPQAMEKRRVLLNSTFLDAKSHAELWAEIMKKNPTADELARIFELNIRP